MKNKISINGHDLSKTQIGATEFQVSIFRNDKFDFQFNVSLQPTGKDDLLPTYQLTNKSQTIPSWTKENLNVISDWIIKNEV
jgi:hypothetical protein